jgi:hypothetical protein
VSLHGGDKFLWQVVMLIFLLITITLFLLPDILINRFTSKAPLPSDLEAWKLTLTGQSHDSSRMNTKHFGNFVSIKNFFYHFRTRSFLSVSHVEIIHVYTTTCQEILNLSPLSTFVVILHTSTYAIYFCMVNVSHSSNEQKKVARFPLPKR